MAALSPQQREILEAMAQDTGAFRLNAAQSAALADAANAALRLEDAAAELLEAARKVLSLHDYASADGRGFNGDNFEEWEQINLRAAVAKFKDAQ